MSGAGASQVVPCVKAAMLVPVAVIGFDILVVIGLQHPDPNRISDGIGCRTGSCPEPARIVWRVFPSARPLPNDLVPKVPAPKNAVHENLDVVAHQRVAVHVNRTGRLQHPFKTIEPLPQVHQIVRSSFFSSDEPCSSMLTQTRMNSLNHCASSQFSQFRAKIEHELAGLVGEVAHVVVGPLLGRYAVLLEQHRTGAVGVEGWIEVDQVGPHALSVQTSR